MLFIILVFLIELVSLSYEHMNISHLNCFNDYEDTMFCEFASDQPLNCSAYSLNLVSEYQDHFNCTFMSSSKKSNSLPRCGCTIKMLLMANTEQYARNLLEGHRVINRKIITALDNIKPRAPEILSVVLMDNGNYNIVYKKNYNEHSFLYDSLEIQLSYRKKEETDVVWRTVNATMPSQEIPGSDLEPSSKYIVKARSHSPHYNTQFSDWSREVEWIVPASVQSLWKVVILVLSVLLIIIICVSYWCWTRLKAQWWDKIPSPGNNIKYMLPGNPKVFTPKLYDPSSFHPDALTITNTMKESRVFRGRSECDRDVSYENVSRCQLTIDKGVGFHEDSRTRLGGSVGFCSSSQLGYRNILCPGSPGPPSQGSMGCGSRSSAVLSEPGSDSCLVTSEPGVLETPILLAHLHRKLHGPHLFREVPSMPTDFKYQPCDGGSTGTPAAEGANEGCSKADILGILLQNPPAVFTCVLPCRADDGYEPFGEAIARTAQGNFPACTLGPCEEGYQVLKTMVLDVEHPNLVPSKADADASSVDIPESCTGEDQNFSLSSIGEIPNPIIFQFVPKGNFESPSHSVMITPPGIQTFIDSSYHRV